MADDIELGILQEDELSEADDDLGNIHDDVPGDDLNDDPDGVPEQAVKKRLPGRPKNERTGERG